MIPVILGGWTVADVVAGASGADGRAVALRAEPSSGSMGARGGARVQMAIGLRETPSGNHWLSLDQPIRSPSGRYFGVFIGAIHDWSRLSAELPGMRSSSTPDIETVVTAVDDWGIEGAVRRLSGGFALILWDRQREELWLVRDRLGIKPLYYGLLSHGLVFASDLSVFARHLGYRTEIDRDALHLYLRYSAVPAPYTIYRGIHKVRPGTLVRFRAPRRDAMDEVIYWSATKIALDGQRQPFAGSPAEAVDQLHDLLRGAVEPCMRTDTMPGAFLSGGVDSSTVVALAQAHTSRQIKTFALGSPDAGFDEAQHARTVAKHLGTAHTELVVGAAEAQAIIPRLATIYDEPFADYSQIPTLLACDLACRSVPVVLAGDGGDEIFAGYNRYVWAGRVWRANQVLPSPARAAIARALTSVAPDVWDRGFERLGAILPTWLRHRMPGYKIHKLAGSLSAQSPLALYRHLTSYWTDPSRVVLGGKPPAERGATADQLADFTSQMMLMDLLRYLPDDGLVKVERASRAVGLGVHLPLLDDRVLEFAWRLPLDLKIREGTTKWVLRQVLYRYVPGELIERPKMGFGVPLGAWLRGPLRDWAEAMLEEHRLRQDGYFDPAPIREIWAQHLAGTHSWECQLWSVLMFQSWLEQCPSPTGAA